MESVWEKEQRESWKWPFTGLLPISLNLYLNHYFSISLFFPILLSFSNPNTPSDICNKPIVIHTRTLIFLSRREERERPWQYKGRESERAQWEVVALAVLQWRFPGGAGGSWCGMTRLPLSRKGHHLTLAL